MKKLLAYLTLILTLMLVSCRAVQAPVPAPLVRDAFSCRPDVTSAMVTAWEETLNGESGAEAGFRMDATKRGYEVVPHDFTNEQGSLTTVLSGTSVAEFHVHPRGSGGAPSTPDNNVFGDSNFGDTKVADEHHIDIYTFNDQGLFVYRWRTKQTVKLRDGYEWQLACR